MNNIDLYKAIGGIDEKFVAEADESKGKTVRAATFAPRLKWALPVAACFVIAVAIAVPQLINKPNAGGEGGGSHSAGADIAGGSNDGAMAGGASPADGLLPAKLDDIRGLPTSDYTWDEGDTLVAARMLTDELRYLMREFTADYKGANAVFAIVTVENAERFTDNEDHISNEGQIANCGVLFDVIGDGITMPLKIKQYLYGGCTGEEETNLIRVGGVYVLPLVKMVNDEIWSVYGDLDCLFEVDDKGLIHSHSRFPQLSKYDGQELSLLWRDIEYLSMNPILTSTLAEDIGYGYAVETVGDTIRLADPINGWNDEDTEGFSAQIVDGIVTIATDNFNVFRPIEGMTADEMNAEIDRIKEYIADGY
jgi:hypothetical protein